MLMSFDVVLYLNEATYLPAVVSFTKRFVKPNTDCVQSGLTHRIWKCSCRMSENKRPRCERQSQTIDGQHLRCALRVNKYIRNRRRFFVFYCYSKNGRRNNEINVKIQRTNTAPYAKCTRQSVFEAVNFIAFTMLRQITKGKVFIKTLQ